MSFTTELSRCDEALAGNNPMKCVIVSTEKEMFDTMNEMREKGLRLAAVSNAGLPDQERRLTFLPESCFTDAAPPLPNGERG